MILLKACPFCGEPVRITTEGFRDDAAGRIACFTTGCPWPYKLFNRSVEGAEERAIAAWNNRPIEKALKLQISALKQELYGDKPPSRVVYDGSPETLPDLDEPRLIRIARTGHFFNGTLHKHPKNGSLVWNGGYIARPEIGDSHGPLPLF